MTNSRRPTWLAASMLALSLSLWALGMFLWLTSASRHMPTRAGPVAASMVSAETPRVADGAGLEVGFATVFLAVATVGALIAAGHPGFPLGGYSRAPVC